MISKKLKLILFIVLAFLVICGATYFALNKFGILADMANTGNNSQGPASTGKFKFGLSIAPKDLKPTIIEDMNNLGTNSLRYINSDLYFLSRQADLTKANQVKDSGVEVMGTWFPQGNILPDRNSSILSSNGTKYVTYLEVIADLQKYSDSKSGPPQWDKVKTLLEEQYFKGIAIPRTLLYKGTTKKWQTWNEPNNFGTTGIPAEVLSLLVTGSVRVNDTTVTFAGQKILGSDNKLYDLSKGASGLLDQLCSDCQLAGSNFSGPNEAYFTILKNNNYMDFIDAEDIHLNLQPGYAINYTKYWTLHADKIHKWLCNEGKNCDKPIYSTEIGSPGGGKLIKTVNGAATGFTMTFSNDFQADDLMKRFVALPALGFDYMGWNGFYDFHGATYNGKNCSPTKDANGFYTFTSPNALCHHQLKGLYATADAGGYVKKPSYTAYEVSTDMLDDASKIDILQQGNQTESPDGVVTRTGTDPTFLFKITDVDGENRYSGWCEPFWNVNTEAELGEKAWNYEDRNCSKTVDLTSEGITGSVTITAKDGATTIALASAVPITKSPIFIDPIITTVPAAPTIGSATAGNTQASVNFTTTDDDGGSAVTGYTVTSNPGGITGTGDSSPITISGLTNGTSYTFTVHATNFVGNSNESGSSNTVVPAEPLRVPSAPTIGVATAGDKQASITFIPPTDNGGDIITGYTAVSTPGGFKNTVASSPVVISGLTNGTSYTFTVHATNSVGDSAKSLTSNAITPKATTNPPSAPTIGTATAGDKQVLVSFTPPTNDGGGIITGYTATSTPGGFKITATSSPIIVPKLANGTTYTFTVHATNSAGDSVESIASNTVTPKAKQTLPNIESINLVDNQVISTNPYLITTMVTSAVGVAKVEYYVDGILIGTSTLPTVSGVYEIPWDTSKYHSVVKIIVYDTTGNKTEVVRNTTVKLPVVETNNNTINNVPNNLQGNTPNNAQNDAPIVSALPKTGGQNWLASIIEKIRRVLGLYN